jgi:serine/threonine protein kinase/TolB-like protein
VTDDLSARLQAALGDGYLIERELGGAGMSRVFAAQEIALARRVVIKVLPPELAAGVNHERFRREIQLAAQLQHPHIVPLLAAGEQGGLLWFSMPFIEGESLRAAIARRGRFPARDVVRVLHDVTDALAYAHARGVVHRDIKPGNILTSGMHALVTDFGVAKALSAAIPSANGGTTTGMAIGTPAYMAPEQLAADPAADHRMDIYAVGLLGYELLTGKSPFGGTSPQATLAAQLTQTPESPSRSLPEVPIGLSNIIMQCLEKDANKRPPSAAALLAELDALPIFGSGEVPSRPISQARRGPMVALLAVIVIAISFAAAQMRGIWSSGVKAGQTESGTKANGSERGSDGTQRTAGALDGDSSGAKSAGARSIETASRAGTVVVYRDTSMTRDGDVRTTLPIVISRAESIAITQAFRQRRAAESPGTPTSATDPAHPGKIIVVAPAIDLAPIARESLIVEMKRVFSDSINAALSHMEAQFARVPQALRPQGLSPGTQAMSAYTPIVAPPTDGKPRVVVQAFNNSTGRRELSSVGRTLADSLRSALGSMNTISVVDLDLTLRANATGAGGASNYVGVGWMLRADYVITGTYFTRGDSIVVMTQLNDVRRGRFTRATTTTAPASDPTRVLPQALMQISAWIDSSTVQRDARDRSGRGGPFGTSGSNGAVPAAEPKKPPTLP